MTSVNMHFGLEGEDMPRVRAYPVIGKSASGVWISIDSKLDSLSMFFRDRAALFNFANDVSRAVADMKEAQVLIAGQDFHSDPTIPLSQRRGGMREHADGLS